jgi:thioredoxin-like negative regulator of GroEL
MANRENRTFNYASAGLKNGISLSFFIVFLITGLSSRAQTYREAKDLATKGQYAEARDLCRKILANEFDSDVATLMARTYAWDGKYDSTRVLISQVLKENPKHWDALDAA